MDSMIKKAAAGATLIAALALVATPSQARWNRGEAAAAGFVAGAAVGAAATSSYYGPRYYGPGYGSGYYGGAYAYEPAYSEPAYSEPVYGGPVYGAPVYAAPASCWVTTDDARGYGYYGACTRFRETPESRQGKNAQ
jgi:hypothetical protein